MLCNVQGSCSPRVSKYLCKSWFSEPDCAAMHCRLCGMVVPLQAAMAVVPQHPLLHDRSVAA
jgi:hypothetical protein